MPWGKRKSGNSVCVYKKDGGKVLHCYTGDGADAKADKYLAALYAFAHKEDDNDLEEVSNGLYMMKEADGRYMITTVSTAALKDRDGETFGVDAIDWDIKEAERLKDYPEYRAFHKKYFGIGRVEKMSRIGIFAVDQGHSYYDEFSLQVCEKMLATNDGKWRCSRGFYVEEASGACPNCGDSLVLTKEHMSIGFRCPSCKQVHMSYKGVLKELHFRKARTFDVTITDIPCVPYTGASAIKSGVILEAKEMNKDMLKKKLLDAGISEELIDKRLLGVDESRLKELDDIPDAVLLKEFEEVDEPEEAEETVEVEVPETDDELFTLDPSVLKEFANITRAIVKEELDGMEIEVDNAETKEYGTEIAELKEKVDAIYDLLTQTDRQRVKEILSDAPRNGKLRVARFKKAKPIVDDEDVEDEDDDEEAEDKMPMKQKEFITIHDADGKAYKSMTEMLTSSH